MASNLVYSLVLILAGFASVLGVLAPESFTQLVSLPHGIFLFQGGIGPIVSAVSFYLVPALIGRAGIWFLVKDKLVMPALSYFIFGSLVVFFSALAINYLLLPVFTSLLFIQVFKLVLGLILGLSVMVNIYISKRQVNFIPREYLQPFILAALLSVVIFLIWNSGSPYSLNWDFLEHQTLTNNILAGKYSFFTSRISDTFIFDGYSSFFHTLLTVAQMFFHPDISGFWQNISFIHLAMVIFASYILALTISGNKNVAALNALIGAVVFETVAFTTLFFIPQTLTATVFILLFVQLLLGIKRGAVLPFWVVALGCLFLLLSHYIIGSVGAIIYLGMYLLVKFGARFYLQVKPAAFIELGIVTSVSAIILSALIPSSALNQGEGQFFNFTAFAKLDFLKQAYGHSWLIFLPLGAFQIIRRKMMPETIMLILALSFLALVFLQAAYVFKFYVLGRFFVNFVMALGIYLFLQRIQLSFLRKFIYGYLVVIFIFIFIFNSINWKGFLHYQNFLTQIAPNEIAAAEFLKSKYRDTDVLLISDPATQNILEAFSVVNSQGGAYANRDTRRQLMAINQSPDPADIRDKLYLVTDTITPSSRRLFVLSGRYFKWQQESEQNKKALYFNIWTPADLTSNDYAYINFLLSDNSFDLVYNNDTLAVLEARQD